MTRFRFIDAQFSDPTKSKEEIIIRFSAHKRGLLAAKKGWRQPTNDDGTLDEESWNDLLADIRLSWRDQKIIGRRAEVISQRHTAASGLSHLRSEDVKKLEGLRQGVRLVQLKSEHHADELAAALHAEFPWMAPATEAVWHAMRRSVKDGEPGLRMPPLLLDGPPGIGKSAWARALGKLINAPTMIYEATNESASFGLVGSQRSWGSARPGRLINTILSNNVGNPVVVVDEVEKSGSPTSKEGQTYSLTNALLPLLEPLSASNWSCPYFEVKFDMSFVNWVMTSNDWRLLPKPLLSRSLPIRLRSLSSTELIAFVRREGGRKGLDSISIDIISEALQMSGGGSGASLRTVLRLIELATRQQSNGYKLH